jgi:hypothetical protein
MAKAVLKISAFLLLLSVAGGSYLALSIPERARETVQRAIIDNGFSTPTVPKPTLSFSGLDFPSIPLDAEGASRIEGLKIHLNWFDYISTKKIESIHISKITHTALWKEKPLDALKKRVKPSQIRGMIAEKIAIDLFQLDLGTDLGDVRVEAKALLTRLDDGAVTVQAVAWARQYQLGFQIPLSGLIRDDGTFLFESTFNDGKAGFGPIRIGRINGWLRLEGQDDTITGLAAQLDSGSAEILSLPLQDLSLYAERKNKTESIVFHSGITGHSGLRLSGHYDSSAELPASGGITLDITDGKDARALLSTLFPDKSAPSLDGLPSPAIIALEYLPERRFVEGPVPFSLSGNSGKNGADPFMAGHILIYPDSLDIRGSVEGLPSILKDFALLMDLPADFATSGSIRIDAGLKPYFVKNPASRP